MWIVILALVFIISITGIRNEPVVLNPKLVSFWNRSIHTSSKAGHQITNWRKPNIHLPAQEYLMGVEMAKNNVCNFFDFGKEADIVKFKRCTHFFPDMLTEYMLHYRARTGVEITF